MSDASVRSQDGHRARFTFSRDFGQSLFWRLVSRPNSGAEPAVSAALCSLAHQLIEPLYARTPRDLIFWRRKKREEESILSLFFFFLLLFAGGSVLQEAVVGRWSAVAVQSLVRCVRPRVGRGAVGRVVRGALRESGDSRVRGGLYSVARASRRAERLEESHGRAGAAPPPPPRLLFSVSPRSRFFASLYEIGVWRVVETSLERLWGRYRWCCGESHVTCALYQCWNCPKSEYRIYL